MDNIEISGYKSIKNQKIELKSINILIGANGSGKSNFLSFFEFLNKIYLRNLNDYIALNNGSDAFLHKGMKYTNEINFKLSFDNGKNGYSVKLVRGNEKFIFINEILYYNNDEGFDISSSQSESNLTIVDRYGAFYVKDLLLGLRKYHFHDTSANSPFHKASLTNNGSYFLYSDGSNIAAYLFYIKNSFPIVYNTILKTIQSIAPFFLDFYLEPNDNDYVFLKWLDKYSETIYGINELSDGTLRFIALATLFLQPKPPSTIIIDEPELGLHPYAIAKLVGLIQSTADRGSQVIISTQSTDLLSYFQPDDIITVDQINGESVFKRLNNKELEEWLNHYSIDDLWKRNLLFSGQPNF